jgi:hypothetical protein
MRREDDDRTGRHLIELVDEHRALGAQFANHVVVVDNLVTDIDRGTESLEGPLDDLDRTIDTRTESARLGQQGFDA